jgi:hypothetical protein
MMHRETSSYNFRIIRLVYKGKKSKGITHIEIQLAKTNNNWATITDPVEIETNIINRNINHFGQAINTPFANGALQQVFGYKGTNENQKTLFPNKLSRQIFIKKMNTHKL